MKNLILLTAVFCLVLFASCKRGFQPIDYGKDACAHCKMTIMDKKFAAEIVDKKGKVFKFDDLLCMKDYVQDHNLNSDELLLLVANFKNPEGDFLDVKNSFLLQSEAFKSPMNGHVAAFASQNEATDVQHETNAQSVDWSSLK
jgi:copper chaperone NosL